MKPIDFEGSTHRLAEDQPEYLVLPVKRMTDQEITFESCWELTWPERFKLLFTGKLWLYQMTFGKLLQPQKPAVTRDE